MWKKSEWWMEGSDPGRNWKNETPDKFTFHFRGSTVVDVTPRDPNAAYPIFQRGSYKQTKGRWSKSGVLFRRR